MKPFLTFVLLGFSSLMAIAQDTLALFEQGNQAYNEARYQEAITAYQAILEQEQHSSALYFNLANSYYKTNQVAESIYYYEKALLLDPEDQEIQHNAIFAQNMNLDTIEVLPKTDLARLKETTIRQLGIDKWAGLILVLVWLSVLFFAGYLWSNSPSIKRLLFIVSLFVFSLATASYLLTSNHLQAQNNTQYGILFDEQIEIKAAPNDRAEIQFLLHEGTKVEVLDGLQDWQKIRIANGAEGWVKAANIRLL